MFDDRFLNAVNNLLDIEGGHVNDPDDPGGETQFGISKRRYPDLDIKNLTREGAIALYHRDWWEEYRYGEIASDETAEDLLELSVNIGPAWAHLSLQRALCSTGVPVKKDGVLGPVTRRAVNTHPCPGWLLAELRLEAVRYYLRHYKAKYFKGWVARAVG